MRILNCQLKNLNVAWCHPEEGLRRSDLACSRKVVLIVSGYHQRAGNPLSGNALLGRHTASAATVRRRLRRLKSLGLVLQTRSVLDRRMSFFTMNPELLRRIGMYRSFFADVPRSRTRERPPAKHAYGKPRQSAIDV